MRPGSFFVWFAHRRWFDMIKDCGSVPFRGTPLLVQRWNRLVFATSVQSRFSVRLFIQGIPPQEFSVQTAQDLLPECSIYQVAIESFDKVDLSYFIARAWVDDPDEVPTETVLTVWPRAPSPDPFAHVSLPQGFGLVGGGGEVGTCTEHLPRKLHYPVMVHVDSVTYFPKRPEYAVHQEGQGKDDEDGALPPEEMPHPWEGSVSDDVTRARTGFGLSLAEQRSRHCSYSGRYHRVPGVLQPEERFRNVGVALPRIVYVATDDDRVVVGGDETGGGGVAATVATGAAVIEGDGSGEANGGDEPCALHGLVGPEPTLQGMDRTAPRQVLRDVEDALVGPSCNEVTLDDSGTRSQRWATTSLPMITGGACPPAASDPGTPEATSTGFRAPTLCAGQMQAATDPSWESATPILEELPARVGPAGPVVVLAQGNAAGGELPVGTAMLELTIYK